MTKTSVSSKDCIFPNIFLSRVLLARTVSILGDHGLPWMEGAMSRVDGRGRPLGVAKTSAMRSDGACWAGHQGLSSRYRWTECICGVLFSLGKCCRGFRHHIEELRNGAHDMTPRCRARIEWEMEHGEWGDSCRFLLATLAGTIQNLTARSGFCAAMKFAR